MRHTLAGLMLANAVLFLFGAVQQAGVSIGPLSEPVIRPTSVVETVCALFLIWGGVAVWNRSRRVRGAAMTGNFLAIGGVIVGMVALAAGRGPRTASNDLYHGIMLMLAGAAIVLLLLSSRRVSLRH
jgi:hypothetical protein